MNIARIYVDNFREFYDTTVPLDKINFLVGENSTGKTSILKLIDLFSSSDFWFSGNFRTENVDFSYYGDVNSNTKNSRGITKIGIMYRGDESEGSHYSAVLLTIVAGSNNKTILKSIRAAHETSELDIQVRKRVGYKINNESNFKAEMFEDWCRLDGDTTGFKLVKKELKQYMNNSPYFLVNILMNDNRVIQDNNDIEKEIRPFVDTISPFTWIAPIRIKPQLTYDGNVYDYSSDGAHAPYLLKTIMGKRGNQNTKRIISVLQEFGKESGLFDSVSVKKFSNQGNSPFSIEVITGGVKREITNVGYGVSQVLPIVIEVLNHDAYRFAIQQPEVHLHPRAQASLGSFFFKMVEQYSARFTIETHSDFIIDRFRQRMSKNKFSSKGVSSQVLFFEHVDGENKVHSIKIEDDGSYSEDQPESFRKFFFNEELKNISI